jgi:acylphosphatase
MINQFNASITGRVQMVMFRDFTQRKARKLGIVGTVQNLKDGSVKVVAQGQKETLSNLVSYLQKGSFLSRVDNVSVAWETPIETVLDFTIIY